MIKELLADDLSRHKAFKKNYGSQYENVLASPRNKKKTSGNSKAPVYNHPARRICIGRLGGHTCISVLPPVRAAVVAAVVA